MMQKQAPWWKTAVFYQIYPRSYADSTGNGIGDLRGIINRFSHIEKLGIDAIWFSPFFNSPQKDFGYDISDYKSINPEYGSMADFDELLQLAHKKGIKIVLDMVLNHTSDQHTWFLESRKSKDNTYRDWYIWRDGKGRKPPNNWNSAFGGSAWAYDEQTGQWYYHRFVKEQPDLNYRNPKVKEAMFDQMRFWLDKGVDGFRLDVINMIFEYEDLRNNPRSLRLLPSNKHTAYLFQNHLYDQDLPETHTFCRELRKLVDSYSGDRVLIGEVFSTFNAIRSFYGNNDELHLVFNFDFMKRPFKAQSFQEAIEISEKEFFNPLWPCYVFSNHDDIRLISRMRNDIRKARLLALMLLTLRGAPFIYYGEEIGMKQAKIPRNKVLDPLGKRFWYSPIPIGRDGCRTPMQWDDSINAGFSSQEVETWLPIPQDYKIINVKNQESDPNSMLNFYKTLLKIHKEQKSLQLGELEIIPLHKNCVSYIRSYQSEKSLIVLNFSKKSLLISYREASREIQGKIIFSTYNQASTNDKNTKIKLYRYEGLIIQ
ncbi:MAG: alpha-amylase family glycosyl hydrolase [Promethearchaeota archaeon]